ncbi:MAG: NAD(P)H-dependent oxidoreductase [Syntrophales bacterium]|jgi:putative NADPH-quinone reductase
MEIMVILAHPQKGSFNHSIAEIVLQTIKYQGHRVNFHDLYEEKFNPILPHEEIPKTAPLDSIVLTHCNEITRAAGIIIVHPNWWGQPPAILKGWVDRVMRVGVAYEFAEGDSGEGVPIGLLRAKTALVFNTSNTSRKRELQVFGDPLEVLWKSCIFELCGIQQFHRRMFGVIVTSTVEQRRSWLTEVRETVTHYFPKQ